MGADHQRTRWPVDGARGTSRRAMFSGDGLDGEILILGHRRNVVCSQRPGIAFEHEGSPLVAGG
jgi:hypothetical protein